MEQVNNSSVGYFDVSSTNVIRSCLVLAAIPLIYYLLSFINWYRYILKIGSVVNKFPGRPTHWFFGNLHQLPPPADKIFLPWCVETQELFEGEAFRHWIGPFRPGVTVANSRNVKGILKSFEPKAIESRGAYNFLQHWLGDGLLISSGEKWHRNRHLLTPAFHFDILKGYIQYYNKAADILLEKWEQELRKNDSNIVEIYSSISLCTLDIILKCAFSCDIDVQRQGNKNAYVQNVNSLSKMITERLFTLAYHFDSIYFRTLHGKKFKEICDQVHRTADEIIANRRRELTQNRESSSKRCKDFLDILLLARDDNNVGLSDVEIRNEVDTFLFEGHDTTGSAITFCLYNLASHREYQDRAQKEIDELLQRKNRIDIEWDDLSELHYLTQCIRESLRHSPPVPFIERDLKNKLELDGVELLPGTIIDVPIYTLHHNKKVWGPDHMEYRPERFSPENMKNMDSHAFLPFSAGPRNCIGQNFALHEIKVVVAKLLHRFYLEVDETHEVIKIAELVLRPKTGIKLKLTRRS